MGKSIRCTAVSRDLRLWDFTILRFIDFRFFISICKSPRAARLKKAQRCILQNWRQFSNVGFAKWCAPKGVAVLISLYDLYVIVVIVFGVVRMFPYRRINTLHGRFSRPGPFRFYDSSISRFSFLYINLQTSPGGSLDKDATLNFAKLKAMLLNRCCKMACS